MHFSLVDWFERLFVYYDEGLVRGFTVASEDLFTVLKHGEVVELFLVSLELPCPLARAGVPLRPCEASLVCIVVILVANCQ